MQVRRIVRDNLALLTALALLNWVGVTAFAQEEDEDEPARAEPDHPGRLEAHVHGGEFMGANNTLSGHVTDLDGDSARIEGNGWALRGRLRTPLKAGDRATAVVRLEKIKLAQTPKENCLRLPLIASVYLGNTWEYVFDLGGTTIRGYGSEFMHPGEQLVDIPADHLWLF